MKIGDSVVIKNIIFDLSEVIISGYYGTEKIIKSKKTELVCSVFIYLNIVHIDFQTQ